MTFVNRKFVRDAEEHVDEGVLKEFVIGLEKQGKSLSSIVRSVQCICDIAKTNNTRFPITLHEAYEAGNNYEKIEIRWGAEERKKYKERMKARPGPTNHVTHLSTSYWIDKGYSEEEAVKKISELQTKNALKRSAKSYKDQRYKTKFSSDYWINLGYSPEEAEVLRQPYLDVVKNDLHGMVLRHGEEEGRRRYKKRVLRYTKSMETLFPLRRVGGYVSKESMKVFIPVYKFCRRNGIAREDIYFGLRGSREFFFRRPGKENGGVFVDFCIPKLKLAIEYHGIFWHFREDVEWTNPFAESHVSKERDLEVKSLCEARDFELLVLWSDETVENNINIVLDAIKEKMNE